MARKTVTPSSVIVKCQRADPGHRTDLDKACLKVETGSGNKGDESALKPQEPFAFPGEF